MIIVSRDHRPARAVAAATLALLALTACGTDATPASGGASPVPSRESLSNTSNSTYAAAGYELGVDSTSRESSIVCPLEVATWFKSIQSNGVTANVSVRGPIDLTLDIQTEDHQTITRHVQIDAHHSQSFIDVADTSVAAIQSMTLTAGDGAQGRGGFCTIAPAGGTMTGNQYCANKKWPQEIPSDTVGLDWFDATSSYRELACFNTGKAISTKDGDDVNQDAVDNVEATEILSASPKIGTLVSLSTVVDFRVRPLS